MEMICCLFVSRVAERRELIRRCHIAEDGGRTDWPMTRDAESRWVIQFLMIWYCARLVNVDSSITTSGGSTENEGGQLSSRTSVEGDECKGNDYQILE